MLPPPVLFSASDLFVGYFKDGDTPSGSPTYSSAILRILIFLFHTHPSHVLLLLLIPRFQLLGLCMSSRSRRTAFDWTPRSGPRRKRLILVIQIGAGVCRHIFFIQLIQPTLEFFFRGASRRSGSIVTFSSTFSITVSFQFVGR